jgi:hypothetical protein
MQSLLLRGLLALLAAALLLGLLGCLDGKSPTPPPRVPKPKVALEVATRPTPLSAPQAPCCAQSLPS